MLKINNIKYTVRSQMGNRTKFTIRNVDFSLEPGYVMCLLGKNGSGKTTLLQLLYGIMPADEGNVSWCGTDIFENSGMVRQEVAYVGDESGFFENRTVRENVELLSLLYHHFSYDKWDKYVKLFGIDVISEEQKFNDYSTGQKRQIQLAFALARNPKLLLLDEPAANLDPVFRVEFMELLQQLVATEDISIIISTHILDDVEEIADYIGILHDGEMVLFGDRESILEQKKKETLDKLLFEYLT